MHLELQPDRLPVLWANWHPNWVPLDTCTLMRLPDVGNWSICQRHHRHTARPSAVFLLLDSLTYLLLPAMARQTSYSMSTSLAWQSGYWHDCLKRKPTEGASQSTFADGGGGAGRCPIAAGPGTKALSPTVSVIFDCNMVWSDWTLSVRYPCVTLDLHLASAKI